MWWRRLILGVALTACTKSNPAKHCSDGICTDPNYPYCDTTGDVAGEANVCIASDCSPSDFIACHGDKEIRCADTGTGFVVTSCERGCAQSNSGCTLCGPSETACTNDRLAVCDGDGAVISSTACALGCALNEARCRTLAPSNGLAQYLDAAQTGPDVVLENATFDVITGEVQDGGVAVVIPTFMLAASGTGPAIRVFAVHSAKITQARIQPGAADANDTGPAFALVSYEDVVVLGQLIASPGVGTMRSSTTCNAQAGYVSSSCSNSRVSGGGAGFGTAGGNAGSITNLSLSAAAGSVNGNDSLVPLRGGCSGGTMADSGGPIPIRGGVGGGAIQLVSTTRIRIDGNLSVNGAIADGEEYDIVENQPTLVLSGGGSGGGLLLEAPMVQIGASGQLNALGGDGSDVCTQSNSFCTMRGLHAENEVAATSGANTSCQTGASKPTITGSGGGGLGRIRINTADGTYTKESGAVANGVLTTGILNTQ